MRSAYLDRLKCFISLLNDSDNLFTYTQNMFEECGLRLFWIICSVFTASDVLILLRANSTPYLFYFELHFRTELTLTQSAWQPSSCSAAVTISGTTRTGHSKTTRLAAPIAPITRIMTPLSAFASPPFRFATSYRRTVPARATLSSPRSTAEHWPRRHNPRGSLPRRAAVIGRGPPRWLVGARAAQPRVTQGTWRSANVTMRDKGDTVIGVWTRYGCMFSLQFTHRPSDECCLIGLVLLDV